MAKKNVSDRDYLFLSSMLKARENRMLRRDRLEQMLSSGSFEEAARLLAEIGWPDMTGMGSAAVSEALAGRQAEIYAEIMEEMNIDDSKKGVLFESFRNLIDQAVAMVEELPETER